MVGRLPALRSGGKRQGAQPGQGASELGFQGQRCGRCSVRRLAREKNRRRRILVVPTCSPKPMRTVQRPGCEPSPESLASRCWQGNGLRGDG